uniref:Valine--tRNA ligase, mitochondrial 1-like n=1 Tax=Tanacetum cinerariifolium TaxID=118510 RepID=A0A6L2J4T5_TANCI|nr:valine--tRNA ligase, mitochondrial 1-like [Tanacetum cinerariifolium]
MLHAYIGTGRLVLPAASLSDHVQIHSVTDVMNKEEPVNQNRMSTIFKQRDTLNKTMSAKSYEEKVPTHLMKHADERDSA